MNLPEPQIKTFTTLLSDIEKGAIKIPQFQRDFVWNIQKAAALMDSIIKGYPIGTFIFWRTNERLRSIRNIGNISLPEPAYGEYVDFVLDGQQRLTCLFASLKGLTIEREGNNRDDFNNIIVDLEAGENEQIVKVNNTIGGDGQIKITDLLYGGLTKLSCYPEKYHKKIEEYKKRIESYNYSAIQIKGAPIEIATEIFTRINVGGKALTLFEIMVAKTYDNDRNFDLSEKFDELVDRLTPLNYETISDSVVLQTISLLLTNECKRQNILQLDKIKFIDIWDEVTNAIERAVEYFRNTYRIPVSQLIPFNTLIVPFAFFFYHKRDKPNAEQQKYLQDFFWRCSLAARYSSGVESKLSQDIKRIQLILSNKLPKYDWPIDISEQFIDDNGWFNAGRSYIKAILCIYCYHQPKSFEDNSIVNINNNWLIQANSKNYHHFFPKAMLKRIGEESHYINHIANITIVDDYLNKRQVRDQKPSIYMKKFARSNSAIEQTMKSHLINNLSTYGIWEDDYDAFFKMRIRAISRELKKRIIERDIDGKGSVPVLDDYEEETTIQA